ncbi:hypothetical protein FOG51_02025 [Hanseniaspora uvarum]|nr:hypothetical protein FOG51_02025 [Hanseniaspora uvarum]
MDPTQHPILSIFEEDTNIDLNIAFNEIDILRFNKILINLILETDNKDFDVFEIIRTNLQNIVNKMNERNKNTKEPMNETLKNLNHNRLYCINNEDHLDFKQAYKYSKIDLIDFLNTKWRVNEEKKIIFKEDVLETEIIDKSDEEVECNKRGIEELEDLDTQEVENKKQKVDESEHFGNPKEDDILDKSEAVAVPEQSEDVAVAERSKEDIVAEEAGEEDVAEELEEDAVAEQTKEDIVADDSPEAAVAEKSEDDNGDKESNEVVANNPTTEESEVSAVEDAEESEEPGVEDAKESEEADIEDAEESKKAAVDDAENSAVDDAEEAAVEDAEESKEAAVDDAEEAAVDDAEEAAVDEAENSAVDEAENSAVDEAEEAAVDDAEESKEASIDDDEDNAEDNANDLKKPPITEEPAENAAAEVRTFRSGRKVTRANTESKLEDHEKLTQVVDGDDDDEPVNKNENKPTKESEPTLKRTLRRGRTRGTLVDEDEEKEEPEKKETSPPIRTRRSLRNRK